MMSSSTNSNVSNYTKVLPVCVRREVVNAHHLHQENSNIGIGGGGGGSRLGSNHDSLHSPNGGMIGLGLGGHNGGGHGGGEVKEIIRITMYYPTPSIGTMNPHKEISIRLTNDENPMFFYYSRITDAEYTTLKNQQGLLVDFIGFPNQLISLLEKCDEDERASGGSGPKFLLVIKMVGGTTVLDIVESNPFKYLCHLSLNINPGSDGEVKKYLADVTSNFKKENQILQDKYNHLASGMESELSRLKSQIDDKNIEIIKLKEDVHNQTSLMSTKHFQELSQEKEKMLKLQSEIASKCDQDKNNLDRKHSQIVFSLEERISSLESENRELLQIKYKLETANQEILSKSKNYEEDLKILQQEVTLSRKQNERLDHDYHEKQRAVNTLQNKLTILDSDLKEKQMLLQKQQDYNRTITEQNKDFEDQTSKLRNEVDKLRSNSKTISSDLSKANEIIKKLQDEIWNTHSNNKLQNQINIEQERAIDAKDKQIHHLENELDLTQSSLLNVNKDLSKLKYELEECKNQIELQDKTIKSNDSMISWLNKQLNEYQGLSNLQKFRQNLSQANTTTTGGGLPSTLMNESQFKSTLNPNHSKHLLSSASAVGNKSFPGGNTPSWMHIYGQNVSTPLENNNNYNHQDQDDSSRIETHQISNLNLGMSKAKLDTISEKTSIHTNKTNNSNNNNNNNNGRSQQPVVSVVEKRYAPSANSTAANTTTGNSTRPPTWTKGNKAAGNVTMDNLINRPTFPIWKN